ncbi:hypothetical protein DFH09DRAFT_1386304 [Mycena vulgaris]|nr:hypothetical protein DFH09DRAFT_1386304 [Mycena vulgaris]
MCVLLLFSLCCGIQNRRVQHAEPYIAPPLPLHAGSGFPHGMQYGSPRPPPAQYPYPTGTSDSEYPPVGAAEFAPPPYVKDSGAQYAPPRARPRGIEAAYSPVRTRAHRRGPTFPPTRRILTAASARRRPRPSPRHLPATKKDDLVLYFPAMTYTTSTPSGGR